MCRRNPPAYIIINKMIFKTIKTIIKLIILAFFIILIIGYPIVIYETNPFTFYYDLIAKVIENIKQIKVFT